MILKPQEIFSSEGKQWAFWAFQVLKEVERVCVSTSPTQSLLFRLSYVCPSLRRVWKPIIFGCYRVPIACVTCLKSNLKDYDSSASRLILGHSVWCISLRSYKVYPTRYETLHLPLASSLYHWPSGGLKRENSPRVSMPTWCHMCKEIKWRRTGVFSVSERFLFVSCWASAPRVATRCEELKW